MRTKTLWVLGLGVVLTACEPMSPSPDGPLAPVQVKAPKTAPVASAPSADLGEDDFDFDTEDRTEGDDETEDGLSDIELQARLLGLDPAQIAPPTPALPPTPAPRFRDDEDEEWTPGMAIDGDFGVRLVSTVPDAQPPRAILGLPDGTEKVVQPGTFLPKAKIVVLAVGRNAVQIARFKARGDHATVRTETLTSLFPSAPAALGPAPTPAER